MDFDTLTLGPFTFDGFSPPEEMPLGGRQVVNVHRMPGGLRTVDVMGPDDHDPRWTGQLIGETAFSDMLTLDAMRKQGAELPYSWGAESRTVIITAFHARVIKPGVIKYEIELTYTDDSASPAVAGIGAAAQIVGDLLSAAGIGGAS